MAETQAQFDTDFAALGTLVANLITLFNQAIAKGQAAGVDMTQEDEAAKSMIANINAAIAATPAQTPPVAS